MPVWLPWVITGVSIAVCLYLWFRDVRRIMLERLSTVESAGVQLFACRERAAQILDAQEAAAVLARCEDIYLQALDLYHQHLRKPWIWLPAVLMGFGRITK